MWGRDGNFRKFIDLGSHRGASHWGTWTGYYNRTIRLFFRQIQTRNDNCRFFIGFKTFWVVQNNKM